MSSTGSHKKLNAVDFMGVEADTTAPQRQKRFFHSRSRASLELAANSICRDHATKKSGSMYSRDKPNRFASRDKSGNILARDRPGKHVVPDHTGKSLARDKAARYSNSGVVVRNKSRLRDSVLRSAAPEESRGSRDHEKNRALSFHCEQQTQTGVDFNDINSDDERPAQSLASQKIPLKLPRIRNADKYVSLEIPLNQSSSEMGSYGAFAKLASPLRNARGIIGAAVTNKPNNNGTICKENQPQQWVPGTWESLETQYEISSKLGSGAFGEVYLGTRRTDRLPVAVKIYYRDCRQTNLPRHADQSASDAVTVPTNGITHSDSRKDENHNSLRGLDEATQNELRYADLKLAHPNIVQILTTIRNPRGVCLVMELMGDGALRERMDSRTRIPESDAKEIIARILEALAFLHKHGVIHRDIKPDNVLFNRALKNDAKLADMGLCWISTDRGVMSESQISGIRTSGALGSPYYMAPEVADESRVYGVSADLWSLGVMVYEMLSGELPFTGRNTRAVLRKSAKGRISFTGSVWTDGNLSPSAIPFVEQLLSLDPRERGVAERLLMHPWLGSLRPLQPVHHSLPIKGRFDVGERGGVGMDSFDSSSSFGTGQAENHSRSLV